ncbi:MAG: hypothetical protein HC901_00635, partial [Bdellovibrionaceae bacterium]|nr:hypothetical protein [Pseudobdellovibrionaceae bacterium]
MDYGPEILYRTRTEVIATPYHGNSQGMLFWHETMRLPPADALVRLRERGVSHLLTSSLPSEQVFLQTFVDPGSLYETLRRGESVEGIAAVPLPDALRKAYHLYTVTPPEPAVPLPPSGGISPTHN